MSARALPAHLRKLSRDPATGWPAPYVNAWSSELVEPDCWYVGEWEGHRAACQRSSVGRGHVDFTRQHMNRQRRIVLDRCCQVCRDLDAHLLPIGSVSGQRDVIDGTEVALFAEPLLCTACADFAGSHCPGLIRRRREESLAMVNVEGEYTVAFVTGTHDLVSPTDPLVLWAKIAIPLSGLPAWLAEAIPAWEPT